MESAASSNRAHTRCDLKASLLLFHLNANVIDLLVDLLALFLETVSLSHDSGDGLSLENRRVALSVV